MSRTLLPLLLLLGPFGPLFAEEELPTAPVLPPAEATAALLVDEIPPFDTTGFPPSPSTASGERIWQPACFTHWPPVVYEDEKRHVALGFPVPGPGEVQVGWQHEEIHHVQAPRSIIGKRHSALLWLPAGTGDFSALVQTPQQPHSTLELRIVGLHDPWPHDHLRNGMPVDADGRPVIIRMTRREPEAERKWAIFRRPVMVERTTGEAVLIGDPLAAHAGDCFNGLPATILAATDQRFPHHAILPGLAGLQKPWPRVLVWSPGNEGLAHGTWNGDDERMLALIHARLEGPARPRLVLMLPPLPVEYDLRDLAQERRQLLLRSAQFLGWEIIDAHRLAGPPEEACRLAEGVYTRYPIGSAREAIRAALGEILAGS